MNRFTKIILSRLMFLSLLTSCTSFSQVLCMEDEEVSKKEDKKEVGKEERKKKKRKKNKNKNKNEKVSKTDEKSKSSHEKFFDCNNIGYYSNESLEENVSIILSQISNSIKHCLRGTGDDIEIFAKQITQINNTNDRIFDKLTKQNKNTLEELFDTFYDFDINNKIFGSIEISCVICNALLLLKYTMQEIANSRDFLDVHYVHVRDGLPLLDFSNFAQSLNGQIIPVDEEDKTYKSEDIDVVLYRLNNGEWKVADGLKQSILIQSIRRYAAKNNKLYQDCVSEITDCFSKKFGCSLDPKFGFLGVPAEKYFEKFTFSPLSYVFDPKGTFDSNIPYPFGYNDSQAQLVKNFLSGNKINEGHAFDKCSASIYQPNARSSIIHAWRAFGNNQFPPVPFSVFKENYNILGNKIVKVYRNILADIDNKTDINNKDLSLYNRPRFMCSRTRNRSADCRFKSRNYY